MISIQSLVQAVQLSVDAALHAVSQNNIRLFRSYFFQRNANAPASEGATDQTADTSVSSGEALEPEVIKLQFSRDTPKGPVPHVVTVPLISLVPFFSLQPTEMNFDIDLECIEQDGEIMVAFPRVKKNWLGVDRVDDIKPNAKVTIKIVATGRTPGVSAVIEGYDKVLRAQIPG